MSKFFDKLAICLIGFLVVSITALMSIVALKRISDEYGDVIVLKVISIVEKLQ